MLDAIMNRNDLEVGANGIQGERADAFRCSINSFFEDTFEDYEQLSVKETLKELEEMGF